jgi:predicted GNAT superfamily acetyltransferase
MDLVIRDVDASDLEALLMLNQSEMPHVGSLDMSKLQWFAAHASYFRVAVDGERIAAFLIGLRPGTSYESPNYRWFCGRYDDFAYVDRIAVAEFARRRGIASRLYDDFAAIVPASVSIMTCEVNIKPPNESSMTFHRRLGFHQVGSRSDADGSKEVAMLVKELRSG